VHSTTPTQSDSGPDVAFANDGTFVITYNRGASISDVQVYARRFNSAATPDPEVQVSVTPAIRNLAPRLSMNRTDGTFVVT
jgi:hypothetical protein